MAKRPKRPRDPAQLAKLIGDIAIGERPNDNHKAAQALYFMHYNFARIHKSLRVTPAMEAGVSDHVWELGEIAALGN